MKPTPRSVIVTAAAITAVAVTLTGCSNSSTDTTGSTAPVSGSNIDAAALVDEAATATEQVDSVHFELETTGTIPDLPVSEIVGDLQNRPEVAAQGTATISAGATVEADFVVTGGRMYADLTGGGFSDYGTGDSIYDVSALFDPERGIPNVLNNFDGASSAGTEDIDGTNTEKITGTVSAADLAVLSGSRVSADRADAPVPTTVWINPADDQLVRISVIPVQDATLALTFSQWGEPVTVTQPEVAPVTPEEGGDQTTLPVN